MYVLPSRPHEPRGDAPWLAVGRRAAKRTGNGPACVAVADVYEALARLAELPTARVRVAAEAVGKRPSAALAALRDRAGGRPILLLPHPDHPEVSAAATMLGLHVVRPRSAARKRHGRLGTGDPAPPLSLDAERPPANAHSPIANGDAPPPDRAPLGRADPRDGDLRPEPSARAAAQDESRRRVPASTTDDEAGLLAHLGSLDALRTYLLAETATRTGARRISILALDTGGTHWVLDVARGGDERLPGRLERPISQGLAGRVARTGRALMGRGCAGGPRQYQGSAFAILPMGEPTKPAGVLCLTDWPGDVLPGEQERASLLAWARRSGMALAMARRLERAEAESTRDALTGLPNRRAFERALARESERADRAGTAVAVAVLDVDHFKSVNDRFGHDVGDIVLKCVAERLVEAFRETDLVARWGGEEFAVLLPDLDRKGPEGARHAADRARAHLAASPIPLGPELAPLAVTLSGGVASARPGESAGQVLVRADRALLAAKAGGRNAIVHD